MKNRNLRFGTLLVFLAATMCCTLSASAQHFKKEPKTQKSLEKTLQMVEKMNRHENVYTTELDSVTAEYTKIVLDYDAHSNCTWLAFYFLDDEWEQEFAYEYHYDELDRLITMIDYDVAIKEEYIYNAQSLVEEIYYSYYDNGGVWVPYGKTVISYDEGDRMTLAIGYSYVGGDWMESSKQTWDYEDGLLQANTSYIVNENGEWVGDSRAEYLYDDEGLCTEIVNSNWSEIWYPESKTVYHYDNQQLCFEKIEYGYGEGWYELYKSSYDYDASGNLHTEITFYYQDGTQDWIYRNKFEYFYDEDNNCTDYYEYFYYVYDEMWDLEQVLHTSYGTPAIEYISGLALFWDLFEFEFPIHNKVEQLVMDDEGDYYYLDFHYTTTDGLEEPDDNRLAIWPNPVSQTVHIDGLEANKVQFYNTLGQLVKTVRDANEINVADLPQGVYMLRIMDAEGKVYTNKITIR